MPVPHDIGCRFDAHGLVPRRRLYNTLTVKMGCGADEHGNGKHRMNSTQEKRHGNSLPVEYL